MTGFCEESSIAHVREVRKPGRSLLLGVLAALFGACGSQGTAPGEADTEVATDAALIALCRSVVSEVLGDNFTVAGFLDNRVPTLVDSLIDAQEFGDPSLLRNPAATQCLVFGNEVPERQARVLVALPSDFFVRVGTVD